MLLWCRGTIHGQRSIITFSTMSSQVMHSIRFSWSEMKAFTSAAPVACKLHLETINGMRWLIERRGYLTLYKVFHFSPQLESRSNGLLSFQEMALTLQKSWYPQIHKNYTLDSQMLRLKTWSLKPGCYKDLLVLFCLIYRFVICFVCFVVGCFVFEIGSPYVVPIVEEFYVDHADLKFT